MNTIKDAEKATETKIVEEEDINKEADQANENTECIICGFKSKWHNGLKIHMSKMHRNIEQMDGLADTSELENDEKDDKYENTKHYWETGRLGTFYQFFIDANEVVENCSMFDEEDKKTEKMKNLESRKMLLANHSGTFHLGAENDFFSSHNIVFFHTVAEPQECSKIN